MLPLQRRLIQNATVCVLIGMNPPGNLCMTYVFYTFAEVLSLLYSVIVISIILLCHNNTTFPIALMGIALLITQ